jgi:hypothetical protein
MESSAFRVDRTLKTGSHIAQMLGYLNITGIEVALWLNFKEAKLDWKRVVAGPAEGPRETTDFTDSQCIGCGFLGKGTYCCLNTVNTGVH